MFATTVSPPAAFGAVIFDSFGPGDTFSAAGPYGDDGSGLFQAFRFFATGSGTLSQITVALGRTTAAQNTTVFNLYNGASAVALGALIESFTITNSVTPDSSSPFTGAVVTFNSVLLPTLTSGDAYWLSFTEPEAPNGSSSLWFMNSIGINITRLTGALPAHTNSAPAFRVNADAAVPEPATGMLVVTGAILVALRSRRNRAV